MATGKLLIRDRVFYSTATLGKEISNGMINTYFLLFLTCFMGLNGVIVGFAMCAVRLATIAFDPVMATVVNNTRSKLGKYRPWMLIGALVNTVILVLTFFPLKAPVAWRYVFYLVMYALWSLSYTIVDVPMMSIVPSLANTTAERESISSLSKLIGGFGGFIIGSGGSVLIGLLSGGQNNPNNYMVVAITGAALLIVSVLLMVCFTKERYDLPCENIKLKEVFSIIKGNDQARTFSVCNLLFTVGANVAILQLVYLFIYQPYLDFGKTYIIFNVVACTGQGLAMIFYSLITKKLSSQKVFGLTYIFAAVGFVMMFAMFFVVDVLNNIWVNVILIAIAGSLLMIANGMNQISSMVLLTDIVDYGEYKQGVRSDSALMSLMTILTKAAAAISMLILGIAVAVSKVPAINLMTNTFDGEVTGNMLLILRVFMFLVPIPLMPIGYIIYRKRYRLSGDFLTTIRTEISLRRAKNSSDVSTDASAQIATASISATENADQIAAESEYVSDNSANTADNSANITDIADNSTIGDICATTADVAANDVDIVANAAAAADIESPADEE